MEGKAKPLLDRMNTLSRGILVILIMDAPIRVMFVLVHLKQNITATLPDAVHDNLDKRTNFLAHGCASPIGSVVRPSELQRHGCRSLAHGCAQVSLRSVPIECVSSGPKH